MTCVKDDFVELMTENTKVNGLDDLSSKLVGILYVEPNEVSLEDLAKRTGYSLSSVSTAMKLIENLGLVERRKKPKSRKIFFYMRKDMTGMLFQIIKRKYEKIVLPTKERLPKIIERYRKEKSKEAREELKVAETYYSQICSCEHVLENMLELIKGVKNE